MEIMFFTITALIVSVGFGYLSYKSWFTPLKYKNGLSKNRRKFEAYFPLPRAFTKLLFYNNNENVYLWWQRIGSLIGFLISVFGTIIGIIGIFSM